MEVYTRAVTLPTKVHQGRRTYYALEIASDQGNLENVKLLVDSPSKPPLQDALGIAAAHGHTDIVSFLLDHGAEITPLAVVAASKSGSSHAFQVFLDHGWDINSRGSGGAPVLK
jgi:ankyrin repeat protein